MLSVYFYIYLFQRRFLVLVLDPLDSLAFLPSADARLTFCVREAAEAVLEAVGPEALVLLAVGPRVDSEAFLLVM